MQYRICHGLLCYGEVVKTETYVTHCQVPSTVKKKQLEQLKCPVILPNIRNWQLECSGEKRWTVHSTLTNSSFTFLPEESALCRCLLSPPDLFFTPYFYLYLPVFIYSFIPLLKPLGLQMFRAISRIHSAYDKSHQIL